MAEGVYIDMSSYQKLYNVSDDQGLPEIVFLDKGTSFSFTVFLASQEDTLMSAATLGLWAGPTWQLRGGAWTLWGPGAGIKPLPPPPRRHRLPGGEEAGSGRGSGRS